MRGGGVRRERGGSLRGAFSFSPAAARSRSRWRDLSSATRASMPRGAAPARRAKRLLLPAAAQRSTEPPALLPPRTAAAASGAPVTRGNRNQHRHRHHTRHTPPPKQTHLACPSAQPARPPHPPPARSSTQPRPPRPTFLFSSSALRSTKRVCGMGPSTLSTSSSTPSERGWGVHIGGRGREGRRQRHGKAAAGDVWGSSTCGHSRGS